MSEDPRSKAWVTRISVMVLLLVAILFIAFAITQTLTDLKSHEKWETRGQSGDFWGGHIGMAANGAGLFLLAITLLLQRRELELQRKEIDESQKIAQEQRDAISQQTRSAEQANNIQLLVRLLETREAILTHMLCTKTIREQVYDGLENNIGHSLTNDMATTRTFLDQSHKAVTDLTYRGAKPRTLLACDSIARELLQSNRVPKSIADALARQFDFKEDDLK